MREAGATAAQELAFTLADAIAYVEAAVARGLDVDAFAGRLSFFFAAWSELFEEVAKFRAARRMWARIMRDRFGATEPALDDVPLPRPDRRAARLTAQSIDNNVVRTTVQALAAVLGGAQSLHTNSPRRGPRPADRGGGPPGPADAADPGPRVRRHRDARPAGRQLLRGDPDERAGGRPPAASSTRSTRMGGTLAAIEAGFQQRQIQESAYRVQRAIERGDQVVVGVNRFRDEERRHAADRCASTPRASAARSTAVRRVRAERDPAAWAAALRRLDEAARGDGEPHARAHRGGQGLRDPGRGQRPPPRRLGRAPRAGDG